jgi:hypothetical protein
MRNLSSGIIFLALLIHSLPTLSQQHIKQSDHDAAPSRSKVPRGTDQAIRDLIVLLHPSWSDSRFDILVSGRRSIGQLFGVYPWYFAVTQMSEKSTIIHGFSPSATPCQDPDECFVDLAGQRPYLIGKYSYLRDGTPAYEGSRPDLTDKNLTFQRSVKSDASASDINSSLLAAGARYAPSSGEQLRKHLRSSALFSKYRVQLRILQFCRVTGSEDNPKVAMYWFAHVFSGRWKRNFLMTIEPFEGDVTSLIPITQTSELEVGCKY